MDTSVAYQYATHRNIPWNIPEYQPLRLYEGRKSMPSKDAHKTRRGFYMQYMLKVAKALPGPNSHPPKDPWDQKKNQKISEKHKINPQLSKNTYIDEIQREEKNRKKPGLNKYNLDRPQTSKPKKRSEGEKSFFYQDVEFLSNSVPGMGKYNPHEDVPHIKFNKTDFKFWQKKHAKEHKSFTARSSKEPAPGTYEPCEVQFQTFRRIQTARSASKKHEASKNGFGSDAKFPYQRPSKRKIEQIRPAPTQYEIEVEWKGKAPKSKTKSWMESTSTGFHQSVYH